MVVQGTYRTRLLAWKWTWDVDARPRLRSIAPACMAATVTVPFTWWAPLLALGLSRLRPLPTGVEEVLALGAVAVLLGATALGPRRELPLWRWRQELEAGIHPLGQLADELAQLAPLVQPSGAVGHVGGIGADTVGLHEVLDAEALLRAAATAGVPRASELRSRVLGYLASQALPGGGFPVYPGGGGRLSLTVRALSALGGASTAAERARHDAFIRACEVPGGGFARSPGQPATAEETRLAERHLHLAR